MDQDLEQKKKKIPLVNEIFIISSQKKKMIMERTVEKNRGKKRFIMIDGPPFANSEKMHYGHIAVSTFKSVIYYFFQMNGYDVETKIGYDVHGLPIEMKVNQMLGLINNHDVKKYGVANYNNRCKEIIRGFANKWIPIFERIGRFVDVNTQYTTMDLPYMESVWWAINQFWTKGLIYKGYKIMPYSTDCGTPISLSEASEAYRDVTDKSVYVKFKISNTENKFLLIWTTTPWTLTSNLAIGVNSEINYCEVLDTKSGNIIIVAKSAIMNIYPKQTHKKQNNQDSRYLIQKENVDIIGIQYEPLFDYFLKTSNNYKVINAKYITENNDKGIISIAGTGLVHLAPAFGMEDFSACLDEGIVTPETVGLYCPLDVNGYFTQPVKDFLGKKSTEITNDMIMCLKEKNVLFKEQDYLHRYPYCPRTNTPLIYRATDAFFIKVSSFSKKMVDLNKRINWIPSYVGQKRFHNWISSASDWCISRSRFFGNPIPIFINESDPTDMICIGSIDELVEKARLDYRPTDIHPEFISDLIIYQNDNQYKWCGEVLDCWFESGCVPFAQHHYPFENKDHIDEFLKSEGSFADFVSEGLDQTRGWFYTLLCISACLFDVIPFKNVITNGLILAPDGKKFSKSLNNFTDPIEIFDEYGADPIRLLLIGSPASHGEEVKFDKNDVEKVYFKISQLMNVHNFFLDTYSKFIFHHKNITFDSNKHLETVNKTDIWIKEQMIVTINKIKNLVMSFTLSEVKTAILEFIDDISNWYIKFNRERISPKNSDIDDKMICLSTLHYTLITFCKATAPFIPFVSEFIYLSLGKLGENVFDSVHLCNYPDLGSEVNNLVLSDMKLLQDIITSIRGLRHSNPSTLSLKMPVKKVKITDCDMNILNKINEMSEQIMFETNVMEIVLENKENMNIYIPIPNNKLIGQKFRQNANTVKDLIKSLSQERLKEISELKSKGEKFEFGIEGCVLDGDMIEINSKIELCLEENEKGFNMGSSTIVIDFSFDDDMRALYLSKWFCRIIQNQRKESKLSPLNKIGIYYRVDAKLDHMIENKKSFIERELGYEIYSLDMLKNDEEEITRVVTTIEEYEFEFVLTKLFE